MADDEVTEFDAEVEKTRDEIVDSLCSRGGCGDVHVYALIEAAATICERIGDDVETGEQLFCRVGHETHRAYFENGAVLPH